MTYHRPSEATHKDAKRPCRHYRVLSGMVQMCLGTADHTANYHQYALSKTEVRELATRLATKELDETLRSMAWVDKAVCRDRGDLFYWEGNSVNRRTWMSVDAVLKAKTLCATCPVRRECLTYGIGEQNGIWAGTLPWERRGKQDIDMLLHIMTEQAVEYSLVDREGVA